MHTSEKLTKLRALFATYGIHGYFQPVHDEYMSEYPPACFQRAAWLSGFTGSAGTVVVLTDKAALFVDGRYTLQAAAEADTKLFSIYNSGDISPFDWAASEAKGAMGYDPALFTPAMAERMEKSLKRKNVALIAVPNLVDAVWDNQPPAPATDVFLHEEKYAGESSAEKCARLAKDLKASGNDAAFISAPDSVCWLLNIRAHDVECTPLVLARALLHQDGTVDLFIDPARLPKLPAHIRAQHVSELASMAQHMAGKKILCDDTQTPQSLMELFARMKIDVVRGVDPCVLPKACKNATQLTGIKNAHVRDGAAIVKLLHWLDKHSDIETVSELEVASTLLAFRSEDRSFVESSFPTIAGSGPNGAIVHYRANEKTSRTLKRGELLLLDSGGQYRDGTTDITRTIAIGAPTAEQKDRFTRVLKGHIALARATFPKGTRGSQLDVLARQYLWEVDLDYDHGTGHGVGQFLGVHEGPQRISKRGGDAELQIGMILSNEPGYYKTGEYGIRMENLVAVIPKGKNFLGFDTITCAPIDTRLVDPNLMNEEEKAWLMNYHAWVISALSPLLAASQAEWLERRLTALI